MTIIVNTTEINETSENFDDELYSLATAIALSIVLGCITVAIVTGNLVVILAVASERRLQRAQNYLIVSLAVSDILVGVAVLPLSAAYEALGRRWIFGAAICDFWTFADVGACTASILNMVAIALDRYWSVTDVHYARRSKSQKVIVMMIVAVWATALVVSLLPVIGWKDESFPSRITQQVCLISQNVEFQIFSTAAAFYGPLVIIVVVYVLIYRVAKRRIKRRAKLSGPAETPTQEAARLRKATNDTDSINGSLTEPSLGSMDSFEAKYMDDMECASTCSADSISENSVSESHTSRGRIGILEKAFSESALRFANMMANTTACAPPPTKRHSSQPTFSGGQSATPSSTPAATRRMRKHKRKLQAELKRQRRVFQTLTMVTGTFIILWLPFFVTALIRPLCPACKIHPTMDAIFAWLGWCNSLVNPIIYTVFSPDFRKTFRKILPCIKPMLPRPRRKSVVLEHSTVVNHNLALATEKTADGRTLFRPKLAMLGRYKSGDSLGSASILKGGLKRELA